MNETPAPKGAQDFEPKEKVGVPIGVGAPAPQVDEAPDANVPFAGTGKATHATAVGDLTEAEEPKSRNRKKAVE